MRIWLAALLIIAAAAAACSNDGTATKNCGMPAPGSIITIGIEVQVRDPFGRGQALGTTVVATRQDGFSQSSEGVTDTLNIMTDYNGSGTFDVAISRRFYRDTTLHAVNVTPTECGVSTTHLSVVLELAPGAPPIRALALLGADFLASPGAQAHLIPHFDADPSASRAVTWQVSDANLATVDANGVVTAKCTKAGGTIHVTATSVADSTVTATVAMSIAPTASCP